MVRLKLSFTAVVQSDYTEDGHAGGDRCHDSNDFLCNLGHRIVSTLCCVGHFARNKRCNRHKEELKDTKPCNLYNINQNVYVHSKLGTDLEPSQAPICMLDLLRKCMVSFKVLKVFLTLKLRPRREIDDVKLEQGTDSDSFEHLRDVLNEG